MGLQSHLGWQPLDGRPPPAGCQTSNLGVPWDRYRGFADSGVGKALLLLSLAALALLLAGRLGGRLVASIGVLASLAATCLAIVLI